MSSRKRALRVIPVSRHMAASLMAWSLVISIEIIRFSISNTSKNNKSSVTVQAVPGRTELRSYNVVFIVHVVLPPRVPPYEAIPWPQRHWRGGTSIRLLSPPYHTLDKSSIRLSNPKFHLYAAIGEHVGGLDDPLEDGLGFPDIHLLDIFEE